MAPKKIDLLQGTLEFLILQALRSGEAVHGFGVLRWIRAASGGELEIEEGALYPALHRLEKKGWVEAEWGLSEKNRKAKFYTLTRVGRKQLDTQQTAWSRYVDVVDQVISTAEAAG